MGWLRAITIEKGALQGKKITVGDFNGIMPFNNYSTYYDWFPQVDSSNFYPYAQYAGCEIEDFPTFITQTLGAGTHLLAGIRTSELDPLHPQAGTFIAISTAIRDISISENEWYAFFSVIVTKRVYDNSGHYVESKPLGNYFPEGGYYLKRTPELEEEYPYLVFTKAKIICGNSVHGLENNLVVGMCFGHPNDGATCSSYNACRMKQSFFKSVDGWGTDAEIPGEDDYSPEFGPASEPDGYGQGGVIGTHDKHSDHVGIPTKPQYGFTSAGFLNHYRISAKGLSMLGEALFPEPVGSSSSVEAAIDKLIANSWNSKIIDYIIDCRIIPVTAPATNQENITCGGKVLVHPTSQQPYSAYLVDEDFVDVDCGVITTPLTEGNFLDMISKAKIFIPFYGFVDLAPEYWHGAKIGLYYRFNLMDGSFMVWLTSAPFRSELESAGDMEIIGQYAGNACIHLPINSQSYSQIIGGMITTGAAVVGAAAAGAIGGAAAKTIAAGAVQTAVSGAANIASGRPQLINNNSYNGSAALMSCRTPYLLIEFSEAQFSSRYVTENGLPAIINRVLGTVVGFTTCVNPIINFACEEEEAEEIRNLLRSGVIL